MVDLGIELVGSIERFPSLEDGVCDFENANIDFRVGGRETADKILGSSS